MTIVHFRNLSKYNPNILMIILILLLNSNFIYSILSLSDFKNCSINDSNARSKCRESPGLACDHSYLILASTKKLCVLNNSIHMHSCFYYYGYLLLVVTIWIRYSIIFQRIFQINIKIFDSLNILWFLSSLFKGVTQQKHQNT